MSPRQLRYACPQSGKGRANSPLLLGDPKRLIQMRRRVKSITNRGRWDALVPAQRAAYDRALDALAWMRSEGFSLTRAAKEAGTTPRVVRKYVGSALRRTSQGTVRPRPSDRFFSPMTVITPDGAKTVEVRGSRARSLVGRHANAVRKFVETGDSTDLRKFRGKSVAGQPLATEPEILQRLARRGEIDFEDIYALTA